MAAVITIVILAVIGFFVYTKIIKPQMANAGKAYGEAYKEFEEGKEKLIEEYFADENRFGLFKKVIPDENIKGMTSVVAPKSVGKALGEELKTSITGVRKVNMDMYFLVMTDNNLHHIEFNGENSVDHTVFALANIEGMTVSKAGGLNLKDQLTGVTGDLDRMKFTYKGQEFSFNLYRSIVGYPRFEVLKDPISGNLGYKYFHSAGHVDYKSIHSKEVQLDTLLKLDLYNAFKTAVSERFGVTFPA